MWGLARTARGLFLEGASHGLPPEAFGYHLVGAGVADPQ
jgi:hypothetical protein